MSQSVSSIDDADLRRRFAPALDRIERGAVERELRRELPHAEVQALREAGFTALTVPAEFGGAGRDVVDLTAWLIELAAADSNVAQLLRAHFAAVERFVTAAADEGRERWLRAAAAGAVFGNASHERAGAAVGSFGTRIVPDGEGYLLSGTKYYSTGTLFADWIQVVALDPDGAKMWAIVAADAEGVERVDDWDGFGQRLTGSGTTTFADVRVAADEITRAGTAPSYTTPFVQLVLLATLAGTARAAARDAAEFVRTRTRVYSQGSGPTAATDPLVQQVVGKLDAAAYAAEGIVLHAARAVQEAREHAARQDTDTEQVQRAEHAVVRAQVAVIPLVLAAVAEMFEVGGASATSEGRRLDRHWRNARTVASHNPSIYQARAIGDHAINGADLVFGWATGEAKQPLPDAG